MRIGPAPSRRANCSPSFGPSGLSFRNFSPSATSPWPAALTSRIVCLRSAMSAVASLIRTAPTLAPVRADVHAFVAKFHVSRGVGRRRPSRLITEDRILYVSAHEKLAIVVAKWKRAHRSLIEKVRRRHASIDERLIEPGHRASAKPAGGDVFARRARLSGPRPVRTSRARGKRRRRECCNEKRAVARPSSLCSRNSSPLTIHPDASRRQSISPSLSRARQRFAKPARQREAHVVTGEAPTTALRASLRSRR